MSGHQFRWRLLKAATAFPIIGIDFLKNFKLQVDLAKARLVCGDSCLTILLFHGVAGVLTSVSSSLGPSCQEVTGHKPLVTIPGTAVIKTWAEVVAAGKLSPVIVGPAHTARPAHTAGPANTAGPPHTTGPAHTARPDSCLITGQAYTAGQDSCAALPASILSAAKPYQTLLTEFVDVLNPSKQLPLSHEIPRLWRILRQKTIIFRGSR